MLNQPNNPFTTLHGPDGLAEGSWQTDQNPALRLGWLFAAIALPLVVVCVRLGWLQTATREAYLAPFAQTTERLESIPATDGRILSADGRVLAFDEEFFTLKVHYRWLEDPPDPNWLRSQAYQKLTPAERRDDQRVEQAQAEVLARRKEMWTRLGEITGIAPETLSENRSKIQHRVERIVSLVETKREDREQAQQEVPESSAREHWWERAWSKLAHALTTPPTRSSREPIIIREELDYHPLLENVSFDAVAEIEAYPTRFPGLSVDYGTRRIYPEGTLASHVIGHRAEITPEQTDARKEQLASEDPLDYQPTDRRGIAGIERSYDRVIRGLRGQRHLTLNRQGEILSSKIVRKPRAGEDVALTLDSQLQQRAETILDSALSAQLNDRSVGGASIVTIDVRTGHVVTCANGPRHDLRLYTDFDSAAWNELLNDPRRPFVPRATQMAIAPGSVFKAVTAVSLLQSGKIDPDEPFFCQGFLHTPARYRCYTYRHYGYGHGEITLREAIAQSCNVYFYQAGLTMGEDEMIYWADKFGFGKPTGIELPGEASGNLPRPGRLTPTNRDNWHQSETLGLAIGQSRLTVTPLQIASMMTTIANGGYLLPPTIVQRTGEFGTLDEHESSSRQPRRIAGLEETTIERVKEGLERVVNWPRGTGYKRVRLSSIKIAGKTGTAEVGGGKSDHAWFAGYVPAENPKYAFAVVVEHGGGGGSVAGPLARSLVESMLELGLLEVTTITQTSDSEH